MPEIDPPTTRESGISEAYLKTILEKLPTDHHLLNARALLALPTAGYCTQNEGTPIDTPVPSMTFTERPHHFSPWCLANHFPSSSCADSSVSLDRRSRA